MSRYIDADGFFETFSELDIMPYNTYPSTDVRENVGGRWIPIVKGELGYSAGDFRCSVCGKPNKTYCLTLYCCNCGAIME